MFIADVNVLMNACVSDGLQKPAADSALEHAIDSSGGLGLTSVATSGLIRVGLQTLFRANPSGVAAMLNFVEALRAHPNCHAVEPGPRHWPLFTALVHPGRFGHRQVTDAWFAALAMENDATLMTFDGGFAQFPGLDWIHLKP
jgi:uncharacterized protein